MQLWLLIAAGACAMLGIAAWYLSTRPILYTRLFVSRDERPLVRREIMDGSDFQSRMRRNGVFLLLIGLGCLAGGIAIQ
ncbi:MAG TPA: hypothetical protein VM510_00110 [Caulifigura sp.]|jgi:hypothetical protein|nr:hypothetical protein [Caulifigura sp.]